MKAMANTPLLMLQRGNGGWGVWEVSYMIAFGDGSLGYPRILSVFAALVIQFEYSAFKYEVGCMCEVKEALIWSKHALNQCPAQGCDRWPNAGWSGPSVRSP